MAFILVWAAGRILPKPALSCRFPTSVAVYDSGHHLLRLTLSADDKYRLWVPLEKISPQLIEATLLHEDRLFFRHFGVNPMSLFRAACETYIAGGRRIGGSTISMQLARIMYHVKSRSPKGKIHQILRAMELEFFYSKEEILEAYLNLVPFGRNIEGVAAASLIYFGKTADKLTLPEVLTLAVIPQSPVRRAPGRLSGEPLPAARKALYRKWATEHPATDGEAEVMDLPLITRDIKDLPFLAPHFVDSILGKRRIDGKSEIIGCIKLSMQRLVERHVQAYVSGQRRTGICNAAAMVVDYRTQEIKALVGSADYFDTRVQGQVNLANARRSPGSALKPFIYGLGMDQGIIHPLSVLKDSPLAFGAFSPENFDGRFEGPLSVKDALIRSRNIPALSVAARLSNPGFYDFLKRCGISRMNTERHYGLSLVLGGSEITMEELVTLYTILANRGLLKPLRHTADDPVGEGVRLLSAESSFMTLEMLKENPRPDHSYVNGSAPDPLPVYWKTGTSHGFRDAWAVGIFGPYVLAVWVGNANGEGNPALIGVKAAAPLFFQIVDSMKAQKIDLTEPVHRMPGNLCRVEVCSVSGELPCPHCRETRSTWFIPGKSPIKMCDIHRRIVIDDNTGLAACPPYSDPTHSEVFEFWPSDMLKIFQQAGIPRRVPPRANPDCSMDAVSASGNPPRIVSPMSNLTYALRSSSEDNRTIAFQAITDADAREVYWMLDENYVGKAESGSVLTWKARPGDYVLRAVDDRGRSDSKQLKVTVVQ